MVQCSLPFPDMDRLLCFVSPVAVGRQPHVLSVCNAAELTGRRTRSSAANPIHSCAARGKNRPYFSVRPRLPLSRRALLHLLSLAALRYSSRALPSLADGELPVADIDIDVSEPNITARVYIDFVLDGSVRRVTIGLYGDLLPRVVSNFTALAASGAYTDTLVYRVVPGLTIQLGDTLGNKGKIGRSSFDGEDSFVPDSFRVRHTVPGIVSMVRRPDGSVDSRFFVTTRPGDSLYLDGKYAGFGRVVAGMDVLAQIDRLGGDGFIKRPIRIAECGVLDGPDVQGSNEVDRGIVLNGMKS